MSTNRIYELSPHNILPRLKNMFINEVKNYIQFSLNTKLVYKSLQQYKRTLFILQKRQAIAASNKADSSFNLDRRIFSLISDWSRTGIYRYKNINQINSNLKRRGTRRSGEGNNCLLLDINNFHNSQDFRKADFGDNLKRQRNINY